MSGILQHMQPAQLLVFLYCNNFSMLANSVTGVWVDEFAAMGLDDCLDHIWNRAEVFLDNKDEDKKCALTLALAVSTPPVV